MDPLSDAAFSTLAKLLQAECGRFVKSRLVGGLDYVCSAHVWLLTRREGRGRG